MKRLSIGARTDWQPKLEEDGVLWSVTENGAFWSEAMETPKYYLLTSKEQESLESAGNTVHQLCMEAVEWLLEKADTETRDKWFDAYGIPENFRQLIIDSWENDEWGMYGRFDFIMTKDGPKLLEYNADTPTTLIESSLSQYNWFIDNKHKLGNVDQFNEIHEALVRHWSDMKSDNSVVDKVHFTSFSQIDDIATTLYMAECAKEAGHDICYLPIEEIGIYDEEFVDLDNDVILNCFNLYPWEWMREDEFGAKVPKYNTRWIEPAWKMLLSNKAILALLWERNPDCSYLVPSYIDGTHFELKPGDKWVTKPLLSREGSNITFWECDENSYMQKIKETGGDYDDSKVVCQKYIEWVEYDGCYPMIGVWMVGEDAVGLGIREDDTDVTQNNSRFIPHVFEVE